MYIGIDLGTSGVKLVLINTNGNIQKIVSRNYPLIIPRPSWTEQNPREWFSQTMDGLKELVKGCESSIKGIGFSGQMHGLVVLDDDDNVLHNALLWNDQRTVSEVDYLNRVISTERLILETGNIALTGLTAPKILWLKNNKPNIFRKIAKIMLPKDYLIYKLTGVFASDVSDLSGTLLFNPKTKNYCPEILKFVGIEASVMPNIHESYEVIGKLKKEIKQELNIVQDVIVVPGGGDQAVGAVGAGIIDSGQCSLSLGTSGVLFVATDEFQTDTRSFIQSYAHSNGKYHIMAVMLNAAGVIKWWNESIFNSSNFEKYFEEIEKADINNGLFFLPYLSGERAPINNPNASGVFFGLKLHHKKSDMDKAIVEGVTFAIRDSFDLIRNLGISINQLRIIGGGARSKVWAQMIANILNVEVLTLKYEEGPAIGAAILSMVGNNEFKSVKEACSNIVKLGDTYIQQDSKVISYEKKYKNFSKLYPQLKNLYQSIS